MEKNIIVVDKTEKPIGTTYPKRAGGLVKSGRAVFLDSRTIRLNDVQNQPVPQQPFEQMEVAKMQQEIEFSARDFCVDMDIPNTTAERHFITLLGQNVEEFVVGDWDFSKEAEQIYAEKTFAPNSEILIRFAINGGVNDDGSEICRCVIVPEGNAENRTIYELSQSRFRPTLSKAWEGGLLRVFELPFHTGPEQHYTIYFVSGRCKTGVLPAFSLEEYEKLPDCEYASWWQERQKFLEKRRKEQDRQRMLSILEEGGFRPNDGSGGLFLTDSSVSPELLHELLEKVEKGAAIVLSDVNPM